MNDWKDKFIKTFCEGECAPGEALLYGHIHADDIFDFFEPLLTQVTKKVQEEADQEGYKRGFKEAQKMLSQTRKR